MTAAEMIQTAAARRARLMKPANARFDPEQVRPPRYADVPVHHGGVTSPAGGKVQHDGYVRSFYNSALAKRKAREKQAAHEALKRMEAERRDMLRREREELAAQALAAKEQQKQLREQQTQEAFEAEAAAIAAAVEMQNRPKIKTIARATCHHFRLANGALDGISQKRDLAYYRHICYYVCREYTGRSLPEIGRHFARDHTTVLHGVTKIKGMIADCPRTQDAVRAILELIGLQDDLEVAS